ncbi:hypothetical protein SERLA73DRAFT_79321 [Serpula lacrymans var. lacrymans S7.3]|uniref:peptidyl-tRNA hydrolase n=1 Tax=Serpula lacrymans var. lacrymans (strain S7.3) TaxID=936435 RepID=F8QG05_SERL3|nr:hypothetical protein SERLA73DRAFT_79321 [Serpula lacrymans var. lacrymans S7.3]
MMHSSPQTSSSSSLSPRLSSIRFDEESLATDTANPKANTPSDDDSSNATGAIPTLPLQPAPEKSEKHEDADADPLVIQIVVRRDLLDVSTLIYLVSCIRVGVIRVIRVGVGIWITQVHLFQENSENSGKWCGAFDLMVDVQDWNSEWAANSARIDCAGLELVDRDISGLVYARETHRSSPCPSFHPFLNEYSSAISKNLLARSLTCPQAENWGVGPLMAQVAHAATAVLHETRTRPETIAYLSDLKNMRKVVLQAPDLPSLLKLSSLLSAPSPAPAPASNPPSSMATGTIDQPTQAIPHHLWVEQPENIPTCLALAPNRREKPVRRALDKARCRLWR